MPCDIERLPFTSAPEPNAEADTPKGSSARPYGGRSGSPFGPTAWSPGTDGASAHRRSAIVQLFCSDEHCSPAGCESPAAHARYVVSGGIGAESRGHDGLVALQSRLRISPAGLSQRG